MSETHKEKNQNKKVRHCKEGGRRDTINSILKDLLSVMPKMEVYLVPTT